MEGAHILPRDATRLANELQKVLRDIGKLRTSKELKHNYAQSYDQRVIKWVNKEEGKPEGQNRKMNTGMIKV